MIEVIGLNKSFNDRQILFDINAQFVSGKPNLVIGASGSGKSVLFKCLVGLLIPESGEIRYENRDFLSMPYDDKLKLRKQIGMLFQNNALFDSLTVEENVEFPLKMFSAMSAQGMER